jgi:hypothetical protein
LRLRFAFSFTLAAWFVCIGRSIEQMAYPPPVWLQALAALQRAASTLPGSLPRPDSLVAPHSEEQLEAWRQLEASRRARLDDVVRDWLSHDQWPSTLDATDGYLLLLRIQAANDWIALGAGGAVISDHAQSLLGLLLVEGWQEAFLGQHLVKLGYRGSSYYNGFHDAGGFAV